MKVLNLVYEDKSDIKYKTIHYPDGQQDIILNDINYFISEGEIIRIISRFNSFKDLETIICASKALRNKGAKEIHLYVPYILGSRSDRRFVEGGTSYLVEVVAPILNSLNFESITCLDVHSDVASACINNLRVIDNIDLVKWSIEEIYKYERKTFRYNGILISPDGGALKKIYKVADAIGFKGVIITCSKSRDKDGKLSKTIVPITSLEEDNKDYIIIDDICDGGRTFINIVKEIKEQTGSKTKIYLIISHGIFSNGFEELSKYFDGVYTTNSYKDIRLNQNINDILGASPNLVKQLNIF